MRDKLTVDMRPRSSSPRIKALGCAGSRISWRRLNPGALTSNGDAKYTSIIYRITIRNPK